MHKLTLHSILSPSVFTVTPDTPLPDVLASMESLRISCVVAVDGNHQPLGIFTEQDAIRLMAERRVVDQLCMSDAMSAPPLTAPGVQDFREAYRLISDKGFRHLIVVDDAGKLLGVLSEADFLHHMGMEYLVELKTVSSVMSRDPVTLKENATLADAVDLMEKHKISCIVITRDKKPVGILTERDAVGLARSTKDPTLVNIVRVMKSPVQTIDVDMPLQQAMKQMESSNVRRLVVLEGNILSGIVTRHDIVKTMQGHYLEFLHETLERQRKDLHHAQKQIKQIRQKLLYLSLMEQVNDTVIVSVEESGIIVDCNEQACRSLDYTRDELLRLTIFDIAATISPGKVWQSERDIFARDGQRLVETQLIRRDGTKIPAEVNARLIQKSSESYIVAVVRDLTERKHAEAQLRLQDTALNSSANAIVITDKDAIIQWANAAFSNMTGYTLEEALGKRPRDLVRSGVQPREFYEVLWNTILSGKVWRGELVNKRKDGTLYTEELTITPVYAEDQVITHFIAVKQDISSRKAAEEKLQISERTYRGLLDSAGDAIYVHDETGAILDVNLAAETMYGYSRAEFLGKTPEHLAAPGKNDFDAIRKFLHLAFHGNPQRFEFWGMRKNGEIFPKEVALSNGNYFGKPALVAVARDISKSKQAQLDVEKSLSLLKATLESTADGILVVDADGSWSEFNQKFLEIWGTPQSIIDTRDDNAALNYAITQLEDPEAFINKVHELYAHPDENSFDTFKLKNGHIIERYSIPQYVKENIVGRVWSFRDVTEKAVIEESLRANRAMLQQIIDTAPMSIFWKDRSSTYLGCNSAFVSDAHMESPAQVVGKNDFDMPWSRKEAEAYRADDHAVMENDHPKMNIIETQLQADGKTIWLDTSKAPLKDANGKVFGVLGVYQNITPRITAEEQLREAAAVMQSTHEGVMITDATPRILTTNAAFTKITGYTADDVVGKNPSILNSGRQDKKFFFGMWKSLLKHGFWQGELWNRRKSGEIYPQLLTLSAIYNDQKQAVRYIGVFADITQLKANQAQLEFMAHHDPLTKLPNRALAESRLEQELEQAHRHENQLSVLFIDLDRFKQVNDSFGHLVGDELLCSVAARLGTRLREGDTLGRLGGDEFILVAAPLQDKQDAAVIARDIIIALSEPFKLSTGHEVFIGGSIGISLFPDNGSTVAELTKNADAAMYLAKENGRNQFSFYTPELNADARNKLELENDLRRAVLHYELRLHYQPKVDIRTGQICGAEALARWQKPDGSWVPPNQFIPIAEKSGVILTIGNWVLEQACSQIRDWLDAGLPEVCVAVNVSSRQFRSGHLDKLVKTALAKFKVAAHHLELELTESMLMHEPDLAIATMHKLKKIGVKISLDDFGTGYSNFVYLRRFPIDSLKIDQSFVHGVGTRAEDTMIVDTIIGLAQRMKLRVIAEGVETAEQLAYMRANGCDELQGYYFSKAVPAAEFAEMLRSGKRMSG